MRQWRAWRGRRLNYLLTVLVLCGWPGVVWGDPPTTLVGQVTDVLGRAVVGARVSVHDASGARLDVTTDGEGRYAVELAAGGTYRVVVTRQGAKVERSVFVTTGFTAHLDLEIEADVGGGEVIRIIDRETKPPAVPAKPKRHPHKALPYSDEAVVRDAWAKAWLLLDVDPRGVVTRLKLLKAPGYDLDRIAIEEGFKLRFEPARDEAGRPIRTHIVWALEWPAWGWLVQGYGVASRRPNDRNDIHNHAHNAPVAGKRLSGAYWATPAPVAFEPALDRVPCAGSAPLELKKHNRAYRDCSTYDASKIDTLPWITRETTDAAVAELAAQRAVAEAIDGPRPSRTPAIVATTVTAGFVVATIVAHRRFTHYDDAAVDELSSGQDPERYSELMKKRRTWQNIRTGTIAGIVFTGAVSTFLWTRNPRPSSFSVQPTSGGVEAAFVTSF